jgi:anti-sigma regulatory factor (Ser/Thr protein kinase)
MSTKTAEILNVVVPCTPEAPASVRQALVEVDEIAPIREEARLIASELVTTAVVHAGHLQPDREIAVSAELTDDSLVIRVEDPAGPELAPLEPVEDPAQGSLSLRLVQLFARRWGAERRGRQCVWAELAF